MPVGDVNLNVGGMQGQIPIFPYNAQLATKSDSTVFNAPVAVKALAAGTITVVPWGGQAAIQITVATAPANIEFMVQKVMATGTSLANTDILCIW